MVRWEFIFFLVALISSAVSKVVPDGSAILLASKGVFVLAFALFAAALLRTGFLDRNAFGKG